MYIVYPIGAAEMVRPVMVGVIIRCGHPLHIRFCYSITHISITIMKTFEGGNELVHLTYDRKVRFTN